MMHKVDQVGAAITKAFTTETHGSELMVITKDDSDYSTSTLIYMMVDGQ